MKIRMIITIFILTGLTICGAVIIGFNFGNNYGSAHFHNTYMRPLQSETSQLAELLEQGKLEEAKRQTAKLKRMMNATLEEEKFLSIVNE
jgi:hypothetical protein